MARPRGVSGPRQELQWPGGVTGSRRLPKWEEPASATVHGVTGDWTHPAPQPRRASESTLITGRGYGIRLLCPMSRVHRTNTGPRLPEVADIRSLGQDTVVAPEGTPHAHRAPLARHRRPRRHRSGPGAATGSTSDGRGSRVPRPVRQPVHRHAGQREHVPGCQRAVRDGPGQPGHRGRGWLRLLAEVDLRLQPDPPVRCRLSRRRRAARHADVRGDHDRRCLALRLGLLAHRRGGEPRLLPRGPADLRRPGRADGDGPHGVAAVQLPGRQGRQRPAQHRQGQHARLRLRGARRR